MRIGVDFGGTKIEAVVLAKDGREIARRRLPTPRGDRTEEVLATQSIDTRRGAVRSTDWLGVIGESAHYNGPLNC